MPRGDALPRRRRLASMTEAWGGQCSGLLLVPVLLTGKWMLVPVLLLTGTWAMMPALLAGT